ncbi:hypothetical protein ACFVTX_17900 [Agromyces sp. NPDC058136]|uniref:hypothetical protein n=1 Tax=Agromyces sp. NPDC058136 TaxID=3346354 RepID=UPI0036DECFBA
MRRHSRGRRTPDAAQIPAATEPGGAGAGGAAAGAGATHEGDAGDRALVSGYRLLRRIASGDRASVYLASGAHASDPASPRSVVALRIYEAGGDDARIAAEISAMTADATGTLPALHDVTALGDGRCVLAVERIGGPTLARLLTERALEPGEAVTLLAPIAVAVANLAEAGFVHTRLAPNDVLIDGVGRPRLIGLGAIRRLDEVPSAIERTELLRAGHVALAELVAGVAAATRPHGSLDRAVALITGAAAARPFVRSEALLERALFESAAAIAVRGLRAPSAPGPIPARLAVGDGSSGEVCGDATVGFGPGVVALTEHGGVLHDPTTAAPPRRGLLGTLASLAQFPSEAVEHGAELADVDPAVSLLGRVRRALVARRRAVLVAALIGGAALVLMLTLVPPADPQAAPASGDSVQAGGAELEGGAHGSPNAPGTATSAAPSPEDASATTVADPVGASTALLELRDACLAALDAGCLEQVDQPGSAIERADLALLAGAREGVAIEPGEYVLDAITVTAEMGDAVLMAVPRTAPESEPASLLVMRSEAGWRLRELFD